MGFWLHKSIRVLPGVHVTVSNGGVSYSVGPRNARLTRHPGGRITSSVGLARMGLVHSTTLREARTDRPAPPPPTPNPTPPPPHPGSGASAYGPSAGSPPHGTPPAERPPAGPPPHSGSGVPPHGSPAAGWPTAGGSPVPPGATPYPGPGVSPHGPPSPGWPSDGSPPPGSPPTGSPPPGSSSAWSPSAGSPSAGAPESAGERDLLDALHTGRYADVARTHGRADPVLRLLAAALDGLAEPDPVRARELLAWVVSQGTAPLHSHPFTMRHLAKRTWAVEIAHGAVADLSIGTDVVLLAAAELHQAAGDLDTAVWTVEQADPATPAAISLAELYCAAGRFGEAVDLTAAVSNADDASALLLVFRAAALAGLSRPDDARRTLEEALRVSTRASSVRHRALLERARLEWSLGRRAEAHRDLATVRREDPAFPGLAEAFAELL